VELASQATPSARKTHVLGKKPLLEEKLRPPLCVWPAWRAWDCVQIPYCSLQRSANFLLLGTCSRRMDPADRLWQWLTAKTRSSMGISVGASGLIPSRKWPAGERRVGGTVGTARLPILVEGSISTQGRRTVPVPGCETTARVPLLFHSVCRRDDWGAQAGP
jgi:hypothetical protein